MNRLYIYKNINYFAKLFSIKLIPIFYHFVTSFK